MKPTEDSTDMKIKAGLIHPVVIPRIDGFIRTDGHFYTGTLDEVVCQPHLNGSLEFYYIDGDSEGQVLTPAQDESEKKYILQNSHTQKYLTIEEEYTTDIKLAGCFTSTQARHLRGVYLKDHKREFDILDKTKI